MDNSVVVLANTICPNCGASNNENLKFCGECGHSLTQQIKNCPNCGAKSVGLKFCGECGTPIEQSQNVLQQQQYAQPPQQQYAQPPQQQYAQPPQQQQYTQPEQQQPQTRTVTIVRESNLTDKLSFSIGGVAVMVNGRDCGNIDKGSSVSTIVTTDEIEVIVKEDGFSALRGRFKLTGSNPRICITLQAQIFTAKFVFTGLYDAYML